MGAAAADYDNDGYPDLFVAGINRNILYHNDRNGRFTDVTAKASLSGVDPDRGKMWAVAAGWLDADNDGRLDLFISNYVVWDPDAEILCGVPEQRMYCNPNVYRGVPNQLFHNNGDGTFTDISRSSGIAGSIGKGMGVAFADFDGDGLTDVFVANDSVRNFLFHNRGGKFEEIGLQAGVALSDNGVPVAGMGVDFRDYDNDGLPDVIMTGMMNDTYLLFRNLGKNLLFQDSTAASGLATLTRQLTGWGMGVFDFDNDGWKDAFFANSHFAHLSRYLLGQSALPNLILQNLGNGKFQDASGGAGEDFQAPAHYRGAAFADFDNDGRVDVVVSALNTPARLFRNVTPGAGHWLGVKLVGTASNAEGLGARVRVTLPDGRSLCNHATTSVGYASSSEPIVRFGLGRFDRVRAMEIRWPGGGIQRFGETVGDRILTVCESAGAP
jgi:hypothetical protein